jgi:DNA-binding XRE family transcriptional regulator
MATKTNNNVKHYRKLASLTQNKLAKAVGIAETHLQNIEYGLVRPNVYTAQRFADAISAELRKTITTFDLFPLPSDRPTETP